MPIETGLVPIAHCARCIVLACVVSKMCQCARCIVLTCVQDVPVVLACVPVGVPVVVHVVLACVQDVPVRKYVLSLPVRKMYFPCLCACCCACCCAIFPCMCARCACAQDVLSLPVSCLPAGGEALAMPALPHHVQVICSILGSHVASVCVHDSAWLVCK